MSTAALSVMSATKVKTEVEGYLDSISVLTACSLEVIRPRRAMVREPEAAKERAIEAPTVTG